MDDLAERIRASLENPNSDPWFPELTDELKEREWERLHRDVGLTPANYGTARVLSRRVSAPRDIIRSLGSSSPGAPTIAIEALQPEWAALYRKAGVRFYSSDEILNTPILTCLEDALAIISQVPSLMRTLDALVRSLHVIKPQNENCDSSFSEPHVPFSIFVSVPEERIANDSLRVAEAIVHEAMHLQLTLIEETVKLANTSEKEFFSPWKGEYRTIQGVLHGVYVFRVIDQFLSAISWAQKSHAGRLRYINSRREEIASQMRTIRDFGECSDLTRVGGALVKTLMSQ